MAATRAWWEGSDSEKALSARQALGALLEAMMSAPDRLALLGKLVEVVEVAKSEIEEVNEATDLGDEAFAWTNRVVRKLRRFVRDDVVNATVDDEARRVAQKAGAALDELTALFLVKDNWYFESASWPAAFKELQRPVEEAVVLMGSKRHWLKAMVRIKTKSPVVRYALERSIETGGSASAIELLAKGDAEAALGVGDALLDSVAAYVLKDFEKATGLATDDKEPGAWLLRGCSWFQLGAHREALMCWKRCVELDAANATAYYNAGVVHKRLGDNDAAKKAYEDAVNADPTHALALTNLGVMRQAIGDYEASEELFVRAAAADPKLATPRLNHGLMVLKTKQDWQKAEELFKAAIDADPTDAPSHYHLAMIAYKQGKFDTAQVQFEAALEADENHAETHTYLGMLLHKVRKDDDAAKRHHLAAVAADPSSAEARFKYAAFLKDTGDTAGYNRENATANQLSGGNSASQGESCSIVHVLWDNLNCFDAGGPAITPNPNDDMPDITHQQPGKT